MNIEHMIGSKYESAEFKRLVETTWTGAIQAWRGKGEHPFMPALLTVEPSGMYGLVGDSGPRAMAGQIIRRVRPAACILVHDAWASEDPQPGRRPTDDPNRLDTLMQLALGPQGFRDRRVATIRGRKVDEEINDGVCILPGWEAAARFLMGEPVLTAADPKFIVEIDGGNRWQPIGYAETDCVETAVKALLGKANSPFYDKGHKKTYGNRWEASLREAIRLVASVGLEQLQNVFAVIDPTPLSHEGEAHRLLIMVEQEKIPSPQLIQSSPKDKMIMVFWLYRSGGDEKDGPEKLWWKTQCAIDNRLTALGFKISDTRPDPTTPMSDRTVHYPHERGGVCEFYDLSDLAQRFGADEFTYDADAEKWIK